MLDEWGGRKGAKLTELHQAEVSWILKPKEKDYWSLCSNNIFYTFQSICILQCSMYVSSALHLASGSVHSFILWPQANSSICFWNPFLEYQVFSGLDASLRWWGGVAALGPHVLLCHWLLGPKVKTQQSSELNIPERGLFSRGGGERGQPPVARVSHTVTRLVLLELPWPWSKETSCCVGGQPSTSRDPSLAGNRTQTEACAKIQCLKPNS